MRATTADQLAPGDGWDWGQQGIIRVLSVAPATRLDGHGVTHRDVRVEGKLEGGRDRGFVGTWTVPADSTVEIATDAHGNAVRQEGRDRCWCGCKYWENDRCIDCGGTEPEPDQSEDSAIRRYDEHKIRHPLHGLLEGEYIVPGGPKPEPEQPA